jgi:hypothetical protein
MERMSMRSAVQAFRELAKNSGVAFAPLGRGRQRERVQIAASLGESLPCLAIGRLA